LGISLHDMEGIENERDRVRDDPQDAYSQGRDQKDKRSLLDALLGSLLSGPNSFTALVRQPLKHFKQSIARLLVWASRSHKLSRGITVTP
jgi:hypothetical protein